MAIARHTLWLYRVPAKHIAGTVERCERRRESTFELCIELFRRPTVGAMDCADRPGLVEQKNLVVAHREDLPGDACRRVGAEIDNQRRDLFRRHLLEPRDALLLSVGLGWDRADHPAPGERREAVRAYVEALHVERNAARQADDSHLRRHVVGLAEVADQTRRRGHVNHRAGILFAEM